MSLNFHVEIQKMDGAPMPNLPPHEFIERNTRPNRTPLVPELELFLADEIVPLWHSTEAELEEAGLAPPFWAFAWAGGQALARYILDQPSLVGGRTVLDFASGCGIVGIAAAKSGALSVLCADTDPMAQAACTINGHHNQVSVHTTTEDLIGADLVPDVVLAGDICYEQPMAEKVMPWLESLARRGALVLVGDPGRAYLPKSSLNCIAEYSVSALRALEDSDVRAAGVFKFN